MSPSSVSCVIFFIISSKISYSSARTVFCFVPSQHLRCCLQNPVLHHRPSSCVCLHTRLDFREHARLLQPEQLLFSWTGLCSRMVSILCGTTMLRRARCHACSGTSGATWRRSVLQITSADKRRHETFNQQTMCATNFTFVVLSSISSL